MNTPTAKMPYPIMSGRPHPLGATPDMDGVNFSIFSFSANRITLLLFEKPDDPAPFQTIELDSKKNKTFHFWHVFVVGLAPGIHYAYRADGPRNIYEGHRFNYDKVLIDPYALGNTNLLWNRAAAC